MSEELVLKAPIDVSEAELNAVAALVNAQAMLTAAEIAEYQRRLTEPDYLLINRLQAILYARQVIP